ncbi:CUE domain-containing protein 2-A-like [Glandiceps talaboti]
MEKERIVRNSLSDFLQTNTGASSIDVVDDIVLSYLVSVLEDLGCEDDFDVDEFTEMMEAYIPGFTEIQSACVCEWMFQLAVKLAGAREKENTPPSSTTNMLSGLNLSDGSLSSSVCTTSMDANDTSLSVSSSTSHQQPNITLHEQHVSNKYMEPIPTTSQPIKDSTNSASDDPIRLLLEMFPACTTIEARHCLSVTNGNTEQAAQLMLHRQEASDTDDSITMTTQAHQPGRKKQTICKDDKKLKDSILRRYAYVGCDEDEKEYKPVDPKWEGKKMIRYRDNQVVSTKGERFQDTKKKDDEDMKKTYINLKPAKQYRFH